MHTKEKGGSEELGEMTNKAHNSSKYPILVLHRTAKQKAGQHLVMFHLFAFKNTIKLFFKLQQVEG